MLQTFPVFYTSVVRFDVEARLNFNFSLTIHCRHLSAQHHYVPIRHAGHPLEVEVQCITIRATPQYIPTDYTPAQI